MFCWRLIAYVFLKSCVSQGIAPLLAEDRGPDLAAEVGAATGEEEEDIALRPAEVEVAEEAVVAAVGGATETRRGSPCWFGTLSRIATLSRTSGTCSTATA